MHLWTRSVITRMVEQKELQQNNKKGGLNKLQQKGMDSAFMLLSWRL